MKYLSKLLSMLLIGGMLFATGCTDYDQDIKDIHNELNKIEEQLNGRVATLEADLEAVEAALQGAIDEANQKVAENKEAIEDLQSKDVELDAAIDDALDAIDTNKDDIDDLKTRVDDAVELIGQHGASIATLIEKCDGLQENMTAVQEAIMQINEAVQNHQGSIDSLQSNLDDLKVAFNEYKALNDTAIDDLKDRVKIAEDAIDTLEGTVEDLQEQQGIQAGLIEDLDGRFEEFKTLTNNQLQSLSDADLALNQLIVNLESSFIDYQKIVNEQFTKAFADIAANTTLINENYAEHEREINDLVARLENTIATLDKVAVDVDDLKQGLTKVKEEFASFKAENEKMHNELKDAVAQAVAKAETDLANAKIELTKDYTAKIAELNAELDKTIAQIEAALNVLSIDVKELMGRIQSIVYVPTKADHKADVVALYYDNYLVSEGYVELTFRVTPADAAKQLVDYYTAQSDKAMPIFTLEPQEVTRGAEASFVINSIKLDAKNNDRFTVHATPYLPLAFYNEETSYSVALRLIKNFTNDVEGTEYNADIVSDYVNLVPTKDNKLDRLVLANADETVIIEAGKIVEKVNAYEIEYEDMTAKRVLLEGFTPRYVIKDADRKDVLYTAEELANIGFNVAPITVACSHEASNDYSEVFETLADANFKVVEDETSGLEVVSLLSADKCKKETIGNKLISKHACTIAPGVVFDFLSKVTIVREYGKMVLSDLEYKWRYSDYEATALANPATPYEGGVRTFDLKVNEHMPLIPADLLAADATDATQNYITKNWGEFADDLEIVANVVNGEDKTKFEGIDVTPVAYDAQTNVWKIEISGWEFNNADEHYEIVAKYSFEACDVIFAFNATFTNLIDLEYTHAAYTMDFSKKLVGGAGKDEIEIEENIADVLAKNYPGLVDSSKDAGDGYFADLDEFEAALKLNNPEVNYVTTTKDNMSSEAATKILNKTENYNTNVVSKPWTFLYKQRATTGSYVDSWVGKIKVRKYDLFCDNQNFSFNTSFEPEFENQTMKVTLKTEVNVVMPKFIVKRSQFVVTGSNENGWYSEVKGLWTPDNKPESKVSEFTAQEVDLHSAFNVYVNDADKTPISNDEFVAWNMKREFTFAENQEGPAYDKIVMDDGVISYMDYADYVKVNGKLFVDGIEIRGAFDAYENYTDNYRVVKYDPLNNIAIKEGADTTIDTSVHKSQYSVKVVDVLTLTDKRGVELIDPKATNVAEPWVIGNATTAFQYGVNAGKVYSLNAVKYEVLVADQFGDETNYLDSYLDYTTYPGQLIFSNLNNLKLQEPITIEVTVTLDYPWSIDNKTTVIYVVK